MLVLAVLVKTFLKGRVKKRSLSGRVVEKKGG